MTCYAVCCNFVGSGFSTWPDAVSFETDLMHLWLCPALLETGSSVSPDVEGSHPPLNHTGKPDLLYPPHPYKNWKKTGNSKQTKWNKNRKKEQRGKCSGLSVGHWALWGRIEMKRGANSGVGIFYSSSGLYASLLESTFHISAKPTHRGVN